VLPEERVVLPKLGVIDDEERGAVLRRQLEEVLLVHGKVASGRVRQGWNVSTIVNRGGFGGRADGRSLR
jgi:hypothetical protein